MSDQPVILASAVSVEFRDGKAVACVLGLRMEFDHAAHGFDFEISIRRVVERAYSLMKKEVGRVPAFSIGSVADAVFNAVTGHQEYAAWDVMSA